MADRHRRLKSRNRRHKRVSRASKRSYVLIGCIFIVLLVAPSLGTPTSSSVTNSAKTQLVESKSSTGSEHAPRQIQKPLGPSLNMSNTTSSFGGGIAGISTSYHLEKGSNTSQIKIFEKERRIGGRIGSVKPYKDGSHTDLSADTFDTNDTILSEMLESIGPQKFFQRRYQRLWTAKYLENHLDRVSIWDSSRQTLTSSSIQDPGSFTWKNMASVVRQHAFYPEFWKNVCWFFRTANSYDEGGNGDLVEINLDLSTSFRLEDRGIVARWKYEADTYATTLMWAVNRARFGPDRNVLRKFADEHGMPVKGQSTTLPLYNTNLGSLLDEVAVQLGEKSHVPLNLNSTVTGITRHDNGTFDVHWTSTSSDGSLDKSVENFDFVVIAAPYHQSAIKVEPPLPDTPTNITYMPIWTTQFASLNSLDGRAFGSSENNSPEIIWGVGDESGKKADSDSDHARECDIPPFISISRREHRYGNGCVGSRQNLYQVISQESFSDDGIAAIMSKCGRARETVTFPDQACYELEEWEGHPVPVDYSWEDMNPVYNDEYPEERYEPPPGCVSRPDIRWVHRQFWPNGLVAKGGGERSESDWTLAPGLFYTSEFESRDGASVSGSVYNGKRVADMIEAGDA